MYLSLSHNPGSKGDTGELHMKKHIWLEECSRNTAHAIVMSDINRGNVWCEFILTQADSLWKESMCFSQLIHSVCSPALMCTAVCHRLLWPKGGERARLFKNVLIMSGALLLISSISPWLYPLTLLSLFFSLSKMSHDFICLLEELEGQPPDPFLACFSIYAWEICRAWLYFLVSLTHPWHIHYAVA